MYQYDEKGTTVNHTERSTKSPSRRTGFFATLRAFLGHPGSATPSSPPHRRRRVLAALAVAATLVAVVTPAFAAGPPRFNHEDLRQEVHATRVAIEPFLQTEQPAGWQAEYATSEKLLDEGKGTGAGSGTAQLGDTSLGIGTRDKAGGNEVSYLRHLTPNVTYYARFKAENAGGKAQETIEFKTLPVGEPEIAQKATTIPAAEGSTFVGHGAETSTTQGFTAQLETDGAEISEYSFAYSTSIGGPFTTCATGSVSVAEEVANPEALCTGLTPETHYFARLKATNEKGSVEEVIPFTTSTAKPVVGKPEIRNVTAASAHLKGQVAPHGSKTHWRFESAASQSGPWTPVAGAAGTISQAQAEAVPLFSDGVIVEGELTGLSPSTTHYLRLFAENECVKFCGSDTSAVASFETSGPPKATTFATHALHGESFRLLGAVNPNSALTEEEQSVAIEGAPTGGTFTLTFKGQTTEPIAFNAPAEGPGSVRKALSALSNAPEVFVAGPAGGPYTVWCHGKNVEGNQPQIEADASGLTPSGTVTVATIQQGGEAYDAHSHFEYVSQKQFEEPGGEGGFAKATSTPEIDNGSGDGFKVVGQDLPSLTPGETYRYRIVATNTSPGNPVVGGEEQALAVPATLKPGSAEPCANEASRTGPAANLPDCRSYEQLTPLDKEGAQEAFHYAGGFNTAALPGEDGEHLLLDAVATKWGAGPGAGQSPYFFSRAEGGWRMTAAASQPEFGLNTPSPQVFAPNLTRFGFESGFDTFGAESKDLEFRAGPPGGPYATVATVPRKQVGLQGGWVAASADFSKLILQVEDRKLVEPPTTTKSGFDLYEYSGGELRQVNVGIGTCGARIVHGEEHTGAVSGAHSLSADGSRVFFEAVPGSNCSEPTHLYMRVGGAETRDLGAVSFLAANEAGSEVLLEKTSGEAHEVLLYDTETAAETHLFAAHSTLREAHELRVSAGPKLTALYFASTEQLTPEAPSVSSEARNLYRYDILAEKLHFLVQATRNPGATSTSLIESVSPDGRYAYLGAEAVSGLPGGAKQLHFSGTEGPELSAQIYRYDSTENVVECVSCASPSDSEPRLSSVLSVEQGRAVYNGGLPSYTAVSANGDFAFFSTPAALVPQDVDGEIAPESDGAVAFERFSLDTSPSSDVYEWRRSGIDGCSHVQGCLALITNGRGGYLNLLLGSAHEGRDVFIYTSSQLLPQQDKDTAGDIYDVRIGGGFRPPPPRPVECEGDACSTPFAPPSDLTPSSATFQGAGNLLLQAPPPPVKKTAAQIRAEKLAGALKACKKKQKKKRPACEKQARRAYGPAPKAKKSRKGGKS
jgi:hypothetical protein